MGREARANWSGLKREAFEKEEALKREANRQDFRIVPCSYCGSSFHHELTCGLNPKNGNARRSAEVYEMMRKIDPSLFVTEE